MANEVYLYVPRNLEVEKMLPDQLKEYASCVEYLVHCVVCGQVFWREEGGYVPLKVAYLRKVIPDRVERQLRNWCMNNGVLECDGHYIEGQKAMGYRLTDQYRDRTHRIICNDEKVASRINDLRRTQFHTEIELDVHKHLRSWYLRLDIDVEQATEIALGLDHQDIHLTAIDMITDHHPEFTYCNKGRIHTVVTRLARELRPSLRMEGQPLYNIDIANSQPLVLAMLLMTFRNANNQFTNPLTFTAVKPLNPYLDLNPSLSASSEPPQKSPSVPTTSITMSISSLTEEEKGAKMISGEGKALLKEDERLYIQLCEEGRFYEFLQERAKLLDLTRDEIKVQFYRDVFFGRNQVVTELTKLFESIFPSVMQVIRNAKRKNYRQLACMMQNYESSLIINRVCRRLMDQSPEVPIITIHDSIMTTEQHVSLVQQVMREEFAGVGLHPTLKVECYGKVHKSAEAA